MTFKITTSDQVHFVGIGGIGMSGIAEIMHNIGFKVQGSDTSRNNKNIKRLQKQGLKIFYNHKKKNIGNSKLVVFSSAINKGNPELREAKRKKIPVIQRVEMLSEIVRLKKNIVISGAHGKTTITSLISTLLSKAKLDPMIINGGILNSINSNALFGKGDWAVVEADESDGSFLKIPITYSVVSNIDKEHLDYYKNFNNLYKSFEIFINRTNVLNATAAIGVAKSLGVKNNIIKATLKNFLGVQRRLTKISNFRGSIIYDDYAHHPTEIISVLNAIKSSFENKKIVTVFQPHRYSRVALLKKEFANAFIDSDLVVLCPIYAASEKPIKNINHYELAKLIKKNSKKEVICIENQFDLERFIKLHAYGNEIIVCMGAGSISSWIRDIAVNLKNEH
ncbi:MAG: UDP-N-acetylmuramate--L-alanine ligase [Candidatus Fonsibacter ubiquis]|nr:UDP-N-acetylmuramate--L-alanine ligase [Candidatus Fonsibacter ubiquis]